jgi:hypothetical protein
MSSVTSKNMLWRHFLVKFRLPLTTFFLSSNRFLFFHLFFSITHTIPMAVHLHPNHPYWGPENLRTVLRLVETKLYDATGGTAIKFELNERLLYEMRRAAEDFPRHLVDVEPARGTAALNDVVARRAVVALTRVEEGGQYIPGNRLWANSRKAGRDDDTLADPDRQTADVVLAGEALRWRRHNEERLREVAAEQAVYTQSAYARKFEDARPQWTAAAAFKEL